MTGGRGGFSGRGGGTPAPESFGTIQAQCLAVMGILQGADETPTTQAVAAANDHLRVFASLKARWEAIVRTDLPALNARLTAAGAAAVTIEEPKIVESAGAADDDDIPAGVR